LGLEKLANSWKNGVTIPLSSFPRKRESGQFKGLWIPALHFAATGMTVCARRAHFSAACYRGPNGDSWYQARESETGGLFVRAQGESAVRRTVDRYRDRRVSEWRSSTSRASSALATDWNAGWKRSPANCATPPLNNAQKPSDKSDITIRRAMSKKGHLQQPPGTTLASGR
jgi:hypothetical protein